MTDTNRPPLATGGMSREGTTTIVKINQPELDPADKKVLCSSICQCKDTPGVSKDGRSLKQMCVSNRLKTLDEVLKHHSVYKPEQTYDMTKTPPEPIMDKEVETKTRDLWPGWTKTLWPKDPARPTPYKAGRGYTRRPDVVIVNDPTKPPTQDNIKQVVEIKFPGDALGKGQKKAYTDIAGNENKFVVVKPSDCDCDKPEPNPSKIPVEQLGPAAAGASTVMYLWNLRNGRISRPPAIPAF